MFDPAPVQRNFGHSTLAYDTPPNKQTYVRISMFFNKKPGISYEYFLNHWRHVHADLVTSSKAYKENKIRRYTQFHQSPESKAKGAEIGYPMMDWDACTEFWVDKLEDFDAFTKSDDFIKATRRFFNGTLIDMLTFQQLMSKTS